MNMKACFDACTECRTICLVTLGHCLKLGGENVKADDIDALLDCVTLCGTSVDLMARNSPLCGRNCAVCAEACRRCAEICEAAPPGYGHATLRQSLPRVRNDLHCDGSALRAQVRLARTNCSVGMRRGCVRG